MSKKNIEEKRSLTTTEIAKLFVQGWIAGLEQETPAPEQERARLENMIKNAKHADGGEYDEFILIPTEEPYDGFWGKNGYNCIYVFARNSSMESDWVRLDEGCSDVLWLRSVRGISFDVPTDYPCIRFTTDDLVQIDSQLSAISGHSK